MNSLGRSAYRLFCFETLSETIWALGLWRVGLQNELRCKECNHFEENPLGLRGPATILSYRAILVAIVSQNSFALVLMGYRTTIARHVAKWGIAQVCLCETKCQGGVSRHFGAALTSLSKYRAIWGIAAIVSR